MRLWLLLSSLCLLGSSALDYQLNPGCQTGYTGNNCQNPICPASGTVTPHDGTANNGDKIAQYHSLTCGDTYSLAIDNFISSVYVGVVIDSPMNYPTPQLYDTAGNLIPNDGQQYISSNEMLVYFDLSSTPRGLYTLKVVSQKDGECSIVVTAKTVLTVDGGFVLDPQDDNVQVFDQTVQNQGIGRYPQANSSTFLAFKVQNENYPTQAQSVRIFRDNGPDQQTFDVVARYNCSFPHKTLQSFNCSVFDKYHAEFSGNDNSGNMWTRIYDFVCDASSVPGTQPSPTGTIPTPPPIDECYNNGLLTNGSCYCGEYFEGVQCEFKLCMNGGTLNFRTDDCLCATGWTGNNCEHVQCKTKSQESFYQVRKALGLVIRSAQSMRPIIPQIAQAALNMTQTYSYFDVYVLSVVQNGEVLFTNSYTDPAKLVSAINAIILPPVDKACSESLMLGVNEILDSEDFQRYPGSPIFIFSDGVLNDGIATAGYYLQQATIYRPQLYFMLTDSVSGQCIVDISSEGYQTLLGYAAYSQGLAIKSDVDRLVQTTDMICGTLYETVVLAQNDLLDCRQAPAYQPFFVDSSITDVWIYGIGDNLTMTITYPDMTTRTPTVYWFTGNLHVWLISHPASGAYMVNFKTKTAGASECSYRVTSSSIYTPFFGASTDMLTDVFNKNPVVNVESHLVAKINHVYVPDPIDISAEITLWTNDIQSGRVVLYSSSGLWRDGCAYDLYFGAFQCTIPGMAFYVSIYLTDFSGFTVLRTLTGYCAASLPPSPGEQCQNGGATYNGSCVCPSHFSGQRCEIIYCENQGTPKIGACSCPPGFAGQFCEIIGCAQPNTYIPLSDPDHRSLTFLMHDSITTRSAFRTINDVTSRIVHDITQQHPTWLENYQLIRFNDTYYQTLVDSNSSAVFIQGINNAYLYNQQHSDYSCSNLDFYRTLLDSLSSPGVRYGGIYYIFLYGIPRPDSDSYEKIITHMEDSRIQFNVVQFSANPCGQDYTKDGLMPLAQASGGTYILSSGPNAGNIVKSIPTIHSSGLIFERFVDNCADTTFYVPVDANTQSVTAYIQGELTYDPVYTKPDGTVADRLSVTNIWNDIGSDSRMDQIIQTCDPGWTLNDGHCFYFDGYQATWQDALTKCQSYGGTLATVYSQTEQNWLNYAGTGSKYWIGLNDRFQYGQWVWALSSNTSISLNTTRYQNWNGGAPNDGGDLDNRCVLNDNIDGTNWNPTHCDESHYFACSKDTYNTEFEPGDNSAKNYIPRGVWSVRVRADGPCSIFLRAQSTIQVFPLYTTIIHNDFGALEPLQGTGNNRMIAHVSGLKAGATHSLEYGHVYSDDGKLLQAQTMQHRDSNTCAYDYISTPFQCINNHFQMMMTGVDSFGYMFQRVVPVLCLGAPDAQSCENGATFFDGICICPPNFYGLHCEFIYCQNGGYPGAALGICECPNNFQGQFCELPRCTRGGVVPDVSSDGRTFILALDGSSTGDMANALTNINATLVSLLSGVDKKWPGWFSSYVAVVFRDSGVTATPNLDVLSSTITSSNYNDWAAMIDAELKKNPYQSKQTSRAIFAGLGQALGYQKIKENSYVFVLTNSKAEDIRNEAMVLSATARTHSSINFVFIGDSTAPGGGNDYTDPAVADLFEAAHNSGGSTYQIPTNGSLSDLWLRIVLSYHYSYTLVSHHISDCAYYKDYIQLGSNGTEVIIDIAQGAPVVTVVDSDGHPVPSLDTFSSKTNLLTEMGQNQGNPGVWTIALNGSTSTCMFTIRGQSDVGVIAAFTQDVEIDGGIHDGSAIAFPQANGQKNAVVATIGGGGTLTYVQILDMEEHTLIWSSPLIQRALCAYSYISSQLFVCDRPSFLLAIDGLDAIGHPFRRLLTYHCQGYIPPATPPPPTTTTTPAPTTMTLYPPCDLNTVNADWIFIMDTSKGFTIDEYTLTLGAFRPIFDTLNLATTRLLLGGYDVNSNFFNNTLNTTTSTTQVALNWLDLVITGQTQNMGNNIDGFLDTLNTTILTQDPFRKDVRKIITFVSSIGWDKANSYNSTDHGFNDPTTNMKAFKTGGVEFIPIGFGANANLDQLKQFSTNCLQTAGSPADFYKVAQFVQSKLCGKTSQC